MISVKPNSVSLIRSFMIIILLILNISNIGPDFRNTQSVFDCESDNNKDDFELLGQYWSDFPILYQYNSTMNSSMIDQFEIAMDTWDDLSSEKVFQQATSDEIDSDEIDLVIGYDSLDKKYLGLMGGNGTEYDNVTLFDNANIVINNYYEDIYTLGDEISCDTDKQRVDLLTVMIHELGHVLGLHHSDDRRSTMYYEYSGNFQRTLNVGDIAGFCYLYTCH